MFTEKLRPYTIVLASGSPRRQQFFMEMGLDFEIRLHPVEEVYPKHLQSVEISDYLAKLKAEPFKDAIAPQEIIITSDTIVWHNNTSLLKPKDNKNAFEMLKTLSNDWHKVITSVCFTTANAQKVVNAVTDVKFKPLEDGEIHYYLEHYNALDKAGAYGIQEWIGLVGIEEIKGSYPNVVGLPTQLVYKTLMDMVS